MSWADKPKWSMNIPWNGWGSDNLAKVRMETVSKWKLLFFFFSSKYGHFSPSKYYYYNYYNNYYFYMGWSTALLVIYCYLTDYSQMPQINITMNIVIAHGFNG